MSVILFYSPFDQRSRDTESLMIAFRQQGHRVISLSQSTGAHIHDHVRKFDIETYTHIIPGKRNWLYFLKHISFLVSFCRKHKVNVVYSHLEPANIVSAVAGYFIKARVFVVRHHINEAKLQGFDRSLLYRMTYSLARNIIVVSEAAKHYMVREEKVDADKIVHINLAYDFSFYAAPDPEKVKLIRNNQLTLLAAGRFTQYKRMDEAVKTLQLLRQRGFDARLIVLGRGEEEQNLKSLIKSTGLENHVLLPGHVTNITDYMVASDFLIHPSISESSCVVIKEAALSNLPVIVCQGVGDFDDYIEHEKNGLIVSPGNFAPEAAALIEKYSTQNVSPMTSLLNEKVKAIFSIGNIVSQYENLNRE